MNLFEYMAENPFMTFVLAIVISGFISGFISSVLVSLPNRILRHWNIRKHGYPPVHCDADGDFKEED